MKHTSHLRSAGAPFLAAALCLLAVAAASSSATAQTRDDKMTAAPAAQATQPTGSNADEDFVLNIDVRRIREGAFHAETEVETDGTRGLRLRVGVALRASDIEVLLRNVQGRVRFRANLAPILRLLGERPAAARPAPGTSP